MFYYQEARERVTMRTTAPAVFLTAMAAILLCAVLLSLSAREANQVALARQHSLFRAVLLQSQHGVAHDHVVLGREGRIGRRAARAGS